MALAGYQPTPRVGAAERLFTWPVSASKRIFRVEYFVDSELDKDIFRVLDW